MIVVGQGSKFATLAVLQTAQVHNFDLAWDCSQLFVELAGEFSNGRLIAFGEPFVDISQSPIAIEINNFSFAIILKSGELVDLSKIISLLLLVTVDFGQCN